MNNDHKTAQEEKIVRDFLQSNTLTADENKWFTRRVINRLPPKATTPGRTIMAVATLLAVAACCVLLWYTPQHFPIPRENNITAELLCIYVAIICSILLVTLQVIRFIKTYF